MKRAVKFALSPYRKKKLVIETLILLWLIRIALWIVPFRVMNKWLGYFQFNGHRNGETDWVAINRIVGTVKTGSKFVPFATCLTQALTARTLLRFYGQDAVLQIGVAKDEKGKLLAHAWLEIDKRIIIGKLSGHKRYITLNSNSSVVV